MAKFSIEIIGLTSKAFLDEVKFATSLRRVHTKKLALESQKIIRRVISSRINRPNSTGRLAAFTGAIETLPDGGAGMGNIEILNKEVPYWVWLNFGMAGSGRTIPPVSRGSFSPGAAQPSANAFGAGRWDQNKDGEFRITPHKPITAMNYIEATTSAINSRAAAILSRVTVRSTGILG
jgi:hypothetical protein